MQVSGRVWSEVVGVASATSVPVLSCDQLEVGYGDLRAAGPISIGISAGEAVSLIGANGVGKSTLLMTLVGVLRPLAGDVLWEGRSINKPLHLRAREGLAYVPERRIVINTLSVRDNLRLAHAPQDLALEMFPELERLLDRRAGLLSGGEQQMLTLARALALRPKAIVVDELSMGLAPIIADRLIGVLRQAAMNGVAVLVVEQDILRALKLSDRFYLMRNGTIELSDDSAVYRGRASELAQLLLHNGPTGPSSS